MPDQFALDVDLTTRKLRRLRREIRDKKIYARLARKARTIIRERTRAGKGVNAAGNIIKLADLTDATIQIRKGNGTARTFNINGRKVVVPIRKDKKGNSVDGRPSKLGKGFAQKKSNLTFSGQMLKAIDFTIKRRGFAFELFVADTARTPYPSDSVYNRAPTPSNADVARYVQAGRSSPTYSPPRPFMNMSKGETSKIITEYNRIVKKLIRRLRL